MSIIALCFAMLIFPSNIHSLIHSYLDIPYYDPKIVVTTILIVIVYDWSKN